MMAKTYLITGVTRGIGLEMAKQLLVRGDKVIGAGRHPEKNAALQQLQSQYPQHLRTEHVDVSFESEAKALAERLGASATIDVLVNNAGYLADSEVELASIDLQAVQKMFDINTVGPMRMIRSVLSILHRSPSPVIVNISSRMGSIGDNSSGGAYGYRMSKVALNMFNRSFAIEQPGITSVVLHPGWVQTDMGGKMAPVKPVDAVKGLLNVIDGLNPGHTGRFFDFRGEEIPW